jgi:glucosamine--fructose-6-phosphate aminotransferase (isomerizing)
MYLGSDAIALAPLTDMINYLEDGDVAVITRQGIEFLNAGGEQLRRSPFKIAGLTILAQKGEHRHFMLKEIHEQPEVVDQTLEQFIDVARGTIKMPTDVELDFHEINRVSITACGTSFYAGLVARYWFERYAGLPVEIDIASEFRYRNVPFNPGNLAIFVSQSGETADTLASLEFAKAHGQRVLSVVNVPSSTMARASQIVLPTLAGSEVGVASTKAFTCQLATLACLAVAAGRARGVLSADDAVALVRALAEVRGYMTRALELEPKIRQIARKIAASRHALFIGRGTNYPLALEGALKLKEITYIHAEGYAAGELKHGPIALIEKDLPVVVIAPDDATFEKPCRTCTKSSSRGPHDSHYRSQGGITRITGGLGDACPSRHAGPGGTARLRIAAAASRVPYGARPRYRRRPTAQSRQIGDCRITPCLILWISVNEADILSTAFGGVVPVRRVAGEAIKVNDHRQVLICASR